MDEARIGIAGHAGIGHTHCPGGLIQDDTLGFAVAGAIIREMLGADTRVATVDADPDSNTIRVTTVPGGTAEASPRRGITPGEARLVRNAVGHDALLCQTTALEVLGRMYGQGVLETPSALAAALANGAVDTFARKAPGRFHVIPEDTPGNTGLIGGIVALVHGVSAAVMATVNYATGGLGPNEDLEGNIALLSKRALMQELGMLRCPTFVLEGKAYNPLLSNDLQQKTLLVRVQKGIDNIVVAEALRDAATELGYPVLFMDDAFPRNDGFLRQRTIEVAGAIADTAERLKTAELGSEKVSIVAELARLVSEEAGGISFMTNQVHDVVRATGLVPGTSAVLSMLVTRDYLSHWKIPLLEHEDIYMMKRVVYAAAGKLAERLDEANEVLDSLYEDLAPLESLFD